MTRLERINVRRKNLTSKHRPIIHERTTTSRNVRSIEEQLKEALSTQVKNMKKEPYVNDISLLNRNYGGVITDIIKSAVYHIYVEASQYVADFTDGTASYLTENDLATINNLTLQFTNQFWNRIRTYISGRNTVLEYTQNFHPRSDVSVDFIVTSLATAVATRILSMATLIKAKQLIAQPKTSSYYYKTGAANSPTGSCPPGKHWDAMLNQCIWNDSEIAPLPEDDLDSAESLLDNLGQVGAGIGLGFLGTGLLNSIQRQQSLSNTIVVWVTAFDDRVCPICEPLQGQSWEVNDDSVLIPPDDSHPRCRCRLMLQDGMGSETDLTEPDNI